MKITLFYLLLFSFALGLIPTSVFAINVIPFSGELDLSRNGSYTIKVNNTSDSETAVKISAYSWSIDKQGKETRIPSNDLIFFPRQLLIEKNSSRTIKVSHRDKTPPRLEKAFRIIIEEVPVYKKNKPGATINVLTRYVTAFYIKPLEAASIIRVINSEKITNGFKLLVHNIGNAHTHFIQPEMLIKQNNNTATLTDAKELLPFARTNLLASAQREYEWKIPEPYRTVIDPSKPYDVLLKWSCENCEDSIDQFSFTVN